MRSGRAVLLRAYPEGTPGAQDFEVVERTTAEPVEGQVLLRVLWASIDPAMRTWHARVPTRGSALPLGSVMRAAGVAEVVAGCTRGFSPGDVVIGKFGMQEWHVTDGSDIERSLPAGVEPSLGLGILGHIGLTAYVGLHEVARLQEGETVLISSAAGATGGVAGQLARALGAARVVGIAGGPEKVALCLDDYGFDACIDRHRSSDLAADIYAAAPDGIDVFFDNVGGATLDAALTCMNPGGRVAICGTISISSRDPGVGPRHERLLLDREITMQGFLSSRHRDDAPRMLEHLLLLHREGRLKLREDVVIGVDQAPLALERQLAGSHLGKILVQVAMNTHPQGDMT